MDPKSRSFTILCLALIIILALLIRILHILPSTHYYILSHDSYFFHWEAERILIGEPIPMTLHSGLAYPLAYMAKLTSFIFKLPLSNALHFACKNLPLILTVISIIIIYLATSTIYNRRVGFFAAFTWAFLPLAYFIQAAGYLDRDGLSTLLIMIGAFLFYLSKGWQWKIGKLNIGWLVAGILVAGIGKLIWLEWVWAGRWLLLAVLVVFFIILSLKQFFTVGHEKSFSDPNGKNLIFWKGIKRVGAAIRGSPWQVFLVVICLSTLFEFVEGGFSSRFEWATETIAERLPSLELPSLERAPSPSPGLEQPPGAPAAKPSFKVPIAEMEELTFKSFLASYQFFLIPIAIGLYIGFRKRREPDIFCLSWFFSLLILSLFAKRVLISAIPAACILSGLGLVSIFELQPSRRFLQYFKIIGGGLLLGILLFSSSMGAFSLGFNPRLAPNKNWCEALIYLRENTPKEAIILNWWDYGYWIQDVAQRKPVVYSGFHGYTQKELNDIASAYFAAQPSEAIKIMKKYDADYFIFSKIEMAVLGTIAGVALGGTGRINLSDSLYFQFLFRNKQTMDTLEVTYRNPEVVILKFKRKTPEAKH